jgi:hypothetical protein
MQGKQKGCCDEERHDNIGVDEGKMQEHRAARVCMTVVDDVAALWGTCVCGGGNSCLYVQRVLPVCQG